MTRDAAAESGRRVRRRRVFYIPGYDPFSARRYRELYRTESARQAKIAGYGIEMRGLTGRNPYAWAVTGRMEGEETEAIVEFLAWNDIVKATLKLPIAAIYLLMVRTLLRFLVSGALVPMIRLRPGPMLAGLAPVGFMILYLVAAGLLGWGAAALALAFAAPLWAALLAALAVFLGAMAATRALEPWIYTYYLVCDFAYVATEMGAWPPDLAARLDRFAALIREALAGDADEVLVVGHSSGAAMAVSILAGLVREGLPPEGPVLSFLTLGQAIPMASFLPRAKPLRRDLRTLSARRDLVWVDVSAMADGASFALCDPVAVTGVAPPDKIWPLVLSAAFSKTLSRKRLKYLRWRYFMRHVQYLCAFDRPEGYDYFRITAGPQTLWARFRDRRPSPSREERVYSPHRDF